MEVQIPISADLFHSYIFQHSNGPGNGERGRKRNIGILHENAMPLASKLVISCITDDVHDMHHLSMPTYIYASSRGALPRQHTYLSTCVPSLLHSATHAMSQTTDGEAQADALLEAILDILSIGVTHTTSLLRLVG